MEPVLVIITGIVIAAVSSWITVNLSLRRYHSERWWDRKAEAYSSVIEALHHSKVFCDDHLTAVMLGQELSKEQNQELRARARKANAEIAKAIDVGAFLLSDDALGRLRRYKEEANKASEEQTWFDYLSEDQKAITECLRDMIEIAKRDLKPESTFLGWPVNRRKIKLVLRGKL